jgi:hypothetical protein
MISTVRENAAAREAFQGALSSNLLPGYHCLRSRTTAPSPPSSPSKVSAGSGSWTEKGTGDLRSERGPTEINAGRNSSDPCACDRRRQMSYPPLRRCIVSVDPLSDLTTRSASVRPGQTDPPAKTHRRRSSNRGQVDALEILSNECDAAESSEIVQTASAVPPATRLGEGSGCSESRRAD